MATWYLDNTATGTNAGTSWTNAWQTIGAIVWGVSGVKAGDTLYISGGAVSKTYTGAGGTYMMRVGADGSEGSPITISAGIDSGHNGQVIWDCTGYQQGIQLNGHLYITVTGVRGDAVAGDYSYGWKFCNKTAATSAGYIYYGGGTSAYNIITHIEFDGTADTGNSGDDSAGVRIGGTDSIHNEVAYCWVHGTSTASPWYSSGIIVHDQYNSTATAYDNQLIHHNLIQNLGHDGIVTWNATVHDNIVTGVQGSGHSDSIQIVNPGYSLVYNNYLASEDQCMYIDPNSGYADSHVYVYNNVFYNSGVGIVLQAGSSGFIDHVYIYNNTFIQTEGASIRCHYGNTTYLYIQNNLFGPQSNGGWHQLEVLDPATAFNATTDLDYNIYDTTTHATPDVADFADTSKTFAQVQGYGYETHGAYHDIGVNADGTLTASSDGIGAGVDLSSVFTTDKNGATRTVPWDAGAFRYGISSKLVMILK